MTSVPDFGSEQVSGGYGCGYPDSRDNQSMTDRANGADARPHLLTLTDIAGFGGAESVAEDLAVGADPDRYRRSICVTRPIADVPGSARSLERLRAAGVEILLLDRRNTFDLMSIRPLIRFIRSERVDLIHAHKFGSNVWAAALGRALSVPVIVSHEHTWSFEGHRARVFIDRHVVGPFSDAVIAVSEADRARMISVVGMPPEKLVVVPNGIETRPRGDRTATRRALGIDDDRPVLVQTAMLRPQKAIDVMVRAIAIVRRTHPTVQLLVAGTGDESGLAALTAELGVTDAVSFLGARGDIPDLLAAADVGVLSSDFEGLPLALLEYLSAGLPVAATAVGGVPEIVTDRETALLVPPQDPAAMAAAVVALLDDPEMAARLGARGQEAQAARFSQAAMVTSVDSLYTRLLTARGILPPGVPVATGPAAQASYPNFGPRANAPRRGEDDTSQHESPPDTLPDPSRG